MVVVEVDVDGSIGIACVVDVDVVVLPLASVVTCCDCIAGGVISSAKAPAEATMANTVIAIIFFM